MKSFTSLALLASLAYAAPAPNLTPEQEQRMLDRNPVRIIENHKRCLQWNVIPGQGLIRDFHTGTRAHIDYMSAECLAFTPWESKKFKPFEHPNFHDKDYTIIGTVTKKCSEWKVKVEDRKVQPVCMDDQVTPEDEDEPLPLTDEEAEDHPDGDEAGPPQPNMQLVRAVQYPTRGGRECAGWLPTGPETTFMGYYEAPSHMPFCYIWKNSSRPQFNYTVAEGVFNLPCNGTGEIVVRTEGDVVYPSCNLSEDVGFNASVSNIYLNGTYMFKPLDNPNPCPDVLDSTDVPVKIEKRDGPELSLPKVNTIEAKPVIPNKKSVGDSTCTRWAIHNWTAPETKPDAGPIFLRPQCTQTTHDQHPPWGVAPMHYYMVATGVADKPCPGKWIARVSANHTVIPECLAPGAPEPQTVRGNIESEECMRLLSTIKAQFYENLEDDERIALAKCNDPKYIKQSMDKQRLEENNDEEKTVEKRVSEEEFVTAVCQSVTGLNATAIEGFLDKSGEYGFATLLQCRKMGFGDDDDDPYLHFINGTSVFKRGEEPQIAKNCLLLSYLNETSPQLLTDEVQKDLMMKCMLETNIVSTPFNGTIVPADNKAPLAARQEKPLPETPSLCNVLSKLANTNVTDLSDQEMKDLANYVFDMTNNPVEKRGDAPPPTRDHKANMTPAQVDALVAPLEQQVSSLKSELEHAQKKLKTYDGIRQGLKTTEGKPAPKKHKHDDDADHVPQDRHIEMDGNAVAAVASTQKGAPVRKPHHKTKTTTSKAQFPAEPTFGPGGFPARPTFTPAQGG